MTDRVQGAQGDGREILATMSMRVIVLDDALRVTWSNPAFRAMAGWPAPDRAGEPVAFPPGLFEGGGPALSAALAECRKTGAATAELNLTDGSRRFRACLERLPDEGGGPGRSVVRFEDMGAETALQARMEAMQSELDHRTRNLIAVILSTARISAGSAHSVEQYTEDFCGRLESMSRAYARLAGGGTSSLREVMEDEVSRVAGRSERYTLTGPDVSLNEKALRDVSLLIHELASNAAKHGCFAHPAGTLAVDWTLSQGGLKVVWQEHSPVPATGPDREGFGSVVFDMFPNATVHWKFTDAGLRMEFEVPEYLVRPHRRAEGQG
ncbi:MAG: PAS domain-containing protein [Hyphomonas sp.]|nr:PAS domain-containing protein [Hyphomonas sp.]